MSKLRWIAVGILVLFAVPALAQKTTGTIRGTVTDPTNAVVVGAKVVAKNEQTGLTQTAETNAVGIYAFAQLPVGSYEVSIERAGFKKAIRTKIILNVDSTREVDVQLASGQITETISVEANAVQVQTAGADVSGLISGEQVRELPLNGRNFVQLTLLMPGVSKTDGVNIVDRGLNGGSDISVSGGSVTSNLWLVDGANNNDVGSNRTLLVYPSVDAIEEFKVQRNNYGAEFGQSGGAAINLITKGGTNELHGSAYGFRRSDSMMGKNYFLRKSGGDKQKLDWNDFGATLGGPLIKDKLHFFVSEEYLKDKRQEVRTGQVPTVAMKNGDFTSFQAGCGLSMPIDPLTGGALTSITGNRLNAAGKAFWQLLPDPKGTPTGCNNWTDAIDTPITWHQEHARLDYTLNENTRLMVRYTQDSWKATNLNANMWGDDPWPAVGSDWAQPSKSLVAQLNKNIGQQMVNTLTFSFSANKIEVTRGGTNPGLAGEINGLVPTYYAAGDKTKGGEAQIFSNWGSLGPYNTPIWNEAPWVNNQDLFVLKDDFSAVFGKHFFKAGVLASYNKKNENINGSSNGEAVGINGVAGYLTADGSYHAGTVTGNVVADFLLNGTAFNTSEPKFNKNMEARWEDIEIYLADSWKIDPRVTLDFGVRASKIAPPWLSALDYANFDPAAVDTSLYGKANTACNGLVFPPGKNPCQGLGQAGGKEGDNKYLVPTSFALLAPRLGIAWDVKGDGKLAVRAGLGRFFQRERVSITNNLGNNAPFVPVVSMVRTLNQARDVTGAATSPGYGVAGWGRQLTSDVPNNWQWNLTVQREVAANTTLEVSYVGSKGQNLTSQYDANEVPEGNRLAYSQTGSSSLRPYGGLVGNSQIFIATHDANSIYHALQTQLVSRFGHGSQFQVSYTFGKLLSTDPLNNSSANQSADAMKTDPLKPNLDRGRALIDRTHMFNAALVLALPTLQDQDPAVRSIFGDWQLSTIVTATSGTPVTVYQGSSADWSGTGLGSNNNNQRPNRVDGVDCHASGSEKTQWLNPEAWTMVGFQIGQIGTSGRGVCDGPGLFQVDAALYKTIKLGSKVKLQLRAEAFNVLNRDNFISNGMGTGLVDGVTYNTGNRATATQIVGQARSGGFGQLTTVRDPRLLQLGVKLSF
jgi:hypothetical protein